MSLFARRSEHLWHVAGLRRLTLVPAPRALEPKSKERASKAATVLAATAHASIASKRTIPHAAGIPDPVAKGWSLKRIWNEVQDFSRYFTEGSIRTFDHARLAWTLFREVCVSISSLFYCTVLIMDLEVA